MDKIVVGFTDYFKTFDEFMTDWLSKRFEVVRDDRNPQYLFFCDETFGQNNRNYKNCTKIFYTGENRRAWNYECDYAITFDHFDTDNHYRLPLYVIDHWVMVTKLGMDHIFNRAYERQTDKSLYGKTKFCCFISGNGACKKRNDFFHKLSKYKQVDSAGPLFNNVPIIPRGDEAAKNKDVFMRPYKFNLCFENSSWPGYCTEKLFHAFYSKTIPIYWGSPTAGGIDFNRNAFLNWHDYLDDDKLLEAIIELDTNDTLYESMFRRSMFPETWGSKYFNPDIFLNWFEKKVMK